MLTDLSLQAVQILASLGLSAIYTYVSAFGLSLAVVATLFGALSAAKSAAMWVYLGTLAVAGSVSLGLCANIF